MEIRKMKAEDYDSVYALWLSCRGMGLNDLDDSRGGIERFLARNPETCFTAFEGEDLVGVIMAGSDGRRGYIYHTAVHPNHRRRGIASKLLDTAMQALTDMGINKAALVVFARNDDGNAFWEKAGFTTRSDIIYRNKVINEMVRIDT